MAIKYHCAVTKRFVTFGPLVKSPAKYHAGTKPRRVVVVGDTCVSEEGMRVIVERDKRYQVCGGAHTFHGAGELIRKHRPDILLLEPFLQGRDGIRWIKDIAMD